MSPERSRTSSLVTRYTLTTTSVSVSVGYKRGSVNLMPSSSGERLREPRLGMLASKDCCARNAAGTERSVEG